MSPKELISLGRTDASKPAVIGRWVLDPFVLSEGSCRFSWRQYRFANAYRQTLDLDSACNAGQMTHEQGLRFLRRKDVDAWMNDRLQMQATKRSWNSEERWWVEFDKLYRQEKVPRHRTELLREAGDRIAPKHKASDMEAASKVVINVSPETVMAIREREKAMQAELVKPNDTLERGTSESRQAVP